MPIQLFHKSGMIINFDPSPSTTIDDLRNFVLGRFRIQYFTLYCPTHPSLQLEKLPSSTLLSSTAVSNSEVIQVIEQPINPIFQTSDPSAFVTPLICQSLNLENVPNIPGSNNLGIRPSLFNHISVPKGPTAREIQLASKFAYPGASQIPSPAVTSGTSALSFFNTLFGNPSFMHQIFDSLGDGNVTFQIVGNPPGGGDGDDQEGSPTPIPANFVPSEGDITVGDDSLNQLTDMGYSPEISRRALILHRSNIAQAINWLLTSPEDVHNQAIPQSRINVLYQRQQGSTADPAMVAELIDMGFSEGAAQDALRRTRNDLQMAALYLSGAT